MSDISTLILNKIRESLEKLSKENVGYIDGEDCKAIHYAIDGRGFYISVEETTENK